jgi:hypothetical protein
MLCPASLCPAARRTWNRQHRSGSAEERGLSIIEILAAGVVGALIITAVASLGNISNRTISEASRQEDADSAISRDLETIRGLMSSYTWCSGAGTLEPIADQNRCRTTRKSNKFYYFPKNPDDKNLFISACGDDRSSSDNLLLASLITSLSPPAMPNPPATTRTVTVSDGAAKSLQISYRGKGTPRTVVLTPTVASWCP